MLRVHHSDGKELLRGSILLLRMFLKYSLASRILSETSSKIDLQGCFFWQNLSMSDGFKGKHRVWSLAVGYYQFIVRGRRSFQDLRISKFVRLIVSLPDFLDVRVQIWRPFHDYFLWGSSKSFFDRDFFVLVRSNYTDRCIVVTYRFRVNIDWAPDKEVSSNVQLVF